MIRMTQLPRKSLILLSAALLLAGSIAQTESPSDATAVEQSPKAQAEGATQVTEDATGQEAPAIDTGPRIVAVIRVDSEIYDFVLDSLKRRIARAREQGADHIVIEINTYGGYVTSAIDICKYIKSLDIPTTAWVNDKAISAGSMMGTACDEIIMSPNSVIGDSAPIVMGQNLEPTERAKALTPVLKEFKDNANDNGYPYPVLHAMAELGVKVYRVRNKETAEERIVHQLDYGVMVNGESPETVGQGGAFDAITSFLNIGGERIEVIGLEVNATEDDMGKWERVAELHNGKTLLTLNASEATEFGITSNVEVRSMSDLREHFGTGQLIVIDHTWSEKISGFLAKDMIRGILIIALLLSVYAESQVPGIGFGAAVAVGALILLVAPPFVIGLAEIWHLLAIVLGVILLLVEFFVIPGFGVAGVSGIVCILAGLAFMVVPTDGEGIMPLPGAGMWSAVQMSFLSIISGLIIGLVCAVLLSRYFDTIPFFRRLMLEGPTPRDPNASIAAGGRVEFSNDPVSIANVGAIGQAITDLHPAGRVRFDGSVVDVVSPGDWITAGTEVRICEVAGNRIVVERVAP